MAPVSLCCPIFSFLFFFFLERGGCSCWCSRSFGFLFPTVSGCLSVLTIPHLLFPLPLLYFGLSCSCAFIPLHNLLIFIVLLLIHSPKPGFCLQS